jgi:hypothetical protein
MRRQQAEAAQTDGLIIEQESSTQIRRDDIARRQTIPGARSVSSDSSKRPMHGELHAAHMHSFIDASPASSRFLIIEQESSTQIRRDDIARRQTIPGAIEALKRELPTCIPS